MIIILVILLGITIGSLVYAYSLYKQDRKIIQINVEKQRENEFLEQEVRKKQEELNSIQISVKGQSNILESLTKSTEEMKKEAQDRANEYYNSRIADLRQDYQQVYENLDSELQKRSQMAHEKLNQEEEKLAAAQAKWHSYIEATQRQEAIVANQDYYRLVLDALDLNDIDLLRDLQKRFSKKDIIDKLIWDYYKPAYDALVSRILPGNAKICGIYRITNMITGASYIGQSVDCKERWRQHIKAGLAYGKASNKLYQSMQEHGPENFIFELLEEAPRPQLNEREAYWIEFYKTKEFGMNSTKGNS